jgi:hypothetical protein
MSRQRPSHSLPTLINSVHILNLSLRVISLYLPSVYYPPSSTARYLVTVYVHIWLLHPCVELVSNDDDVCMHESNGAYLPASI